MSSISTKLPETIYAIQHLSFEDVGAWEDYLYALGFRVRYVEAGIEDLTRALNHTGLTIILGGPIGVYETDDYPFLQQEIDLLKVRLEKNLPTLGVCLGAQLIAHSLGANVYAGHQKEIGWSKLRITSANNNPLAVLESTEVLHWHGDTFDLPKGAELLASSNIYPNQAFRFGTNILALQFHAEVAHDSLEKWLIGHRCELHYAGIQISSLRQDNQSYALNLQEKSTQVLIHFLENLST